MTIFSLSIQSTPPREPTRPKLVPQQVSRDPRDLTDSSMPLQELQDHQWRHAWHNGTNHFIPTSNQWMAQYAVLCQERLGWTNFAFSSTTGIPALSIIQAKHLTMDHSNYSQTLHDSMGPLGPSPQQSTCIPRHTERSLATIHQLSEKLMLSQHFTPIS